MKIQVTGSAINKRHKCSSLSTWLSITYCSCSLAHTNNRGHKADGSHKQDTPPLSAPFTFTHLLTFTLWYHFKPNRSSASSLTTTGAYTTPRKEQMKNLTVHAHSSRPHIWCHYMHGFPLIPAPRSNSHRDDKKFYWRSHIHSPPRTKCLSCLLRYGESVWLIKWGVSSLVSKSICLQPSFAVTWWWQLQIRAAYMQHCSIIKYMLQYLQYVACAKPPKLLSVEHAHWNFS